MARILITGDLATIAGMRPYLLTALVLPPARLVYLSSGMHRGGPPSLSDPQLLLRTNRGLTPPPGHAYFIAAGLGRASSSASTDGASAAPIRWNIACARRSRALARPASPTAPAQRPRPASAWASCGALPIARASS